MCGFYSLVVSILEKCGKFRKNGRFSGRIWPDWGNTARADMAGLGSIGIKLVNSRLAQLGPFHICSGTRKQNVSISPFFECAVFPHNLPKLEYNYMHPLMHL